MVFAHPSDLDVLRLGLTVTKRTGNSVVRNRIKRKLRDAFRRRRAEMPRGLDLVINARRSVLESSSEQLERDLVDAVMELHGKLVR
jgi:ribonuclease P protein component